MHIGKLLLTYPHLSKFDYRTMARALKWRMADWAVEMARALRWWTAGWAVEMARALKFEMLLNIINGADILCLGFSINSQLCCSR